MSEKPGSDSLWVAARNGDAAAFEELVISFYRPIFRTVLGMVGNYHEAEDVTQEVFLRAWHSLSKLRPDTSYPSWLRRVAINASIDQLRRRKRSRWWPWSSLPVEEKGKQLANQNEEVAEQVQHALQKLPEHYRTVAVLREIDDLSYNEIAAVLGCSVGTVRSRLSRARERLKDLLKSQLRESEDTG